MSNYDKNINLFYKVISSLSCIEKITDNDTVKNESKKFNKDIIEQYQNYLKNKDVNKLNFNYSEKDITLFSNDCYDKVDIVEFAEDLEFGFRDLIKNILKERSEK